MANLETLLAMVRNDLEDGSAWAVLSDAILEAADPRALLLEVSDEQLAGTLEERCQEWFGRPGKAEGNALSMREDLNDSYSPGVTLTFERGHVAKLKIETNWDGGREGWGQEWMHPLLARIVTQPLGQLIREFEIRATPYDEFHYEGLIESITQGAPLAARMIYCGDNDQLSWTNVPDCTGLWAAAPHLETMTMEGSSIRLGKIVHDRLAVLKLISGGLPAEPVQALAKASLPALTELEIWFGDEEYGAECSVETVRPLLGRSFESLESMALINCAFSDELIAEVASAAWLPQLKTLKLGHGIVRDPGGEALLANADAFKHLERLDLREGFLSEGMQSQLSRTFGDRIDLRDQQVADEYNGEHYYYVSVGE